MLGNIRHVDNYSETLRGCDVGVVPRDNIRDRLCAQHTEKFGPTLIAWFT